MNPILSLFQPGPETILRARHPPAECARRLNEAIDGHMTFMGSKPAIGYVSEHAGQIRQRKWYRNSFQLLMNIAITPDGQGAKLSCRMAPSVFASLFLILWCAVIAIMLIAILANTIARTLSPVFLIVPFIMLGLGIAIAAIGRNLSTSDEHFLLDLLRRTLDAR